MGFTEKQISIRLDPDTINYFKELADSTGITYQSLMNLYLTDCAQKTKNFLSSGTLDFC